MGIKIRDVMDLCLTCRLFGFCRLLYDVCDCAQAGGMERKRNFDHKAFNYDQKISIMIVTRYRDSQLLSLFKPSNFRR